MPKDCFMKMSKDLRNSKAVVQYRDPSAPRSTCCCGPPTHSSRRNRHNEVPDGEKKEWIRWWRFSLVMQRFRTCFRMSSPFFWSEGRSKSSATRKYQKSMTQWHGYRKKSPRNARETMLAHQTHQTHKNTKQKPSPMNGLIQSWSKSWGSRMKLGPPWRKRINRWSVETSQPTCGNSQPSRLPSICHAKQTKHPNQKAHWLQQITMSLLLHIMCNYKPLLATFGGTWRHTCSNLWPKSKRFKKSASRGALMLLASASAPSAQRLLNIAEKKLDAFRDASRDAFRFSPPCEVRSHETGLDQQRHKTCIDQPWIRSKQQKDAFGTDHWSRYY